MGSGLDIAKLTDTIEQLRVDKERSPALICIDPEDPNAWVHLRCSLPSQRHREWTLMLGYPFFDEATKVIEAARIALPPETLILNHKYGIFLTLLLPTTVDPKAIALLISDLMFRLQRITDGVSIEVALEDD